MYADREEIAPKISIKDRLNGSIPHNSGGRRQVTGKRQRQDDDKWEHDLYKSGPQLSNQRVGVHDLRLKLQKKVKQQAFQGAKGSFSSGGSDLREKLSGITYSLTHDTAPPKPKPALKGSKPAMRSMVSEATAKETKKIASAVVQKKTQNKAETVDSFLQELGLEKYSITFQAEEVDMAALLHFNDGDLKAIGIPMGPRKKILLALESKA